MSDEELAEWLKDLQSPSRSVKANQVYIDFDGTWAVVRGDRRAELAALIARAPLLLAELLEARAELARIQSTK